MCIGDFRRMSAKTARCRSTETRQTGNSSRSFSLENMFGQNPALVLRLSGRQYGEWRMAMKLLSGRSTKCSSSDPYFSSRAAQFGASMLGSFGRRSWSGCWSWSEPASVSQCWCGTVSGSARSLLNCVDCRVRLGRCRVPRA